MRTLVLAVLLAATPAAALDVTLSDGDQSAETTVSRYTCSDDRTIEVRYLELGDVALAVVPVTEEETQVFARVISGSGARYAAGPYEWWDKGSEATLSNAMADGDPVTCALAT